MWFSYYDLVIPLLGSKFINDLNSFRKILDTFLLKEIAYKGVISLETRISHATPQPIREELEKQLFRIAKYFAEEIEK